MKDRKQRSVINVVLKLVHDVQMTKSWENILICLLLNVKEVFDHVALKQLIKILIKLKISIFFFILTQFNTHYESMQDFIYCNERCASVALFSYLLSLFFALYTVTVFNARTLWACFFFTFSLFHLILWWQHSLKLI